MLSACPYTPCGGQEPPKVDPLKGGEGVNQPVHKPGPPPATRPRISGCNIRSGNSCSMSYALRHQHMCTIRLIGFLSHTYGLVGCILLL